MATYDDRQWMLTLLQNAYVTTDDTGLCEVVLDGNEGKQLVAEFPFFNNYDSLMNETDDPHPSSPDITSDSKLSSHRHRSYTERKSERLKREREKASRIKRIHWKNRTKEWTESELSEMFQRKVLVEEQEEDPQRYTSMLSYLIENAGETQSNNFIEYAKFDGTAHDSVERQQIDVYLYVGKDPSLDYPFPVNVVSTAKISDLIGLVCWLYTKKNKQPPIKTVDHYQLHIADEDGQCDWEFQPLEKRDVIGKYGFNTLALVEKAVPESNKGTNVIVNFARGEFSRIEVENMDVTLKEILSKSIRWRKEIAKMQQVGVDYHLEKEHEPGVLLNMDKSLAEVDCLVFAAVRDNSKRTNGGEVRSPALLHASAPQSFMVVWEKKKFSKLDTKIEITSDKIEITPQPPRGGNSILGGQIPPPLKYRVDQLIDCNRKPIKRNKVETIITIQGEHQFKNFKFICEPSEGENLFDKCKLLISSKEKRPSYRRPNSFSLRRKTKSDSINSVPHFEI